MGLFNRKHKLYILFQKDEFEYEGKSYCKKDNYYLEKCFSIAEKYNVQIIQCEIRDYDIFDIKKSVIEIKGTKENLQLFLKDFLITIEDIRNIEYGFH